MPCDTQDGVCLHNHRLFSVHWWWMGLVPTGFPPVTSASVVCRGWGRKVRKGLQNQMAAQFHWMCRCFLYHLQYRPMDSRRAPLMTLLQMPCHVDFYSFPLTWDREQQMTQKFCVLSLEQRDMDSITIGPKAQSGTSVIAVTHLYPVLSTFALLSLVSWSPIFFLKPHLLESANPLRNSAVF